MIDSVLQIRWDLIKEDDLNSFHDMLVDIHDREYSLAHMIQILKVTPKYLVVEAINWGFDTSSREALHKALSDPMYRGMIEDPDWVAKTTPKKAA